MIGGAQINTARFRLAGVEVNYAFSILNFYLLSLSPRPTPDLHLSKALFLALYPSSLRSDGGGCGSSFWFAIEGAGEGVKGRNWILDSNGLLFTYFLLFPPEKGWLSCVKKSIHTTAWNFFGFYGFSLHSRLNINRVYWSKRLLFTSLILEMLSGIT